VHLERAELKGLSQYIADRALIRRRSRCGYGLPVHACWINQVRSGPYQLNPELYRTVLVTSATVTERLDRLGRRDLIERLGRAVGGHAVVGLLAARPTISCAA
jgi:hypothetical protein